MNREIKFRGMSLDLNKWVYGYACFDSTFENAVIINKHGNNEMQKWAVDPKSVVQYTGRKDKNGVEIYEGDELLYIGTNMSNMFVKFENGMFVGEGPFTTRPLHDYITALDFVSIEVIGNIYQNPDLIK